VKEEMLCGKKVEKNVNNIGFIGDWRERNFKNTTGSKTKGTQY